MKKMILVISTLSMLVSTLLPVTTFASGEESSMEVIGELLDPYFEVDGDEMRLFTEEIPDEVVAQVGSEVLQEVEKIIELFNELFVIVPEDLANAQEISEQEHEEMITALEEYLSVEDGLYVFEEIPESLYQEFDSEVIDNLIEGVEVVNESAEKGEIEILEDLTIIDPSVADAKEEASMSRSTNRNVTKTTTHWWGRKHYLSRAKTTEWIRVLRRSASFALGVSVASTLAGIGLGTVFSGVARWIYTRMADGLQNRLNATRNRGTIFNAHYTGTWTTAVQ